jgi:hypothetical protein
MTRSAGSSAISTADLNSMRSGGSSHLRLWSLVGGRDVERSEMMAASRAPARSAAIKDAAEVHPWSYSDSDPVSVIHAIRSRISVAVSVGGRSLETTRSPIVS